MKKIELDAIEGAYVIERSPHEDDRGLFSELTFFDKDLFPVFVQQNYSFSYGRVLRGMHLQRNNPQGKLITCAYGTILDVIFDLRPRSSTYLQRFAIELDFRELKGLYAPPGVEHGFLTLSKFSAVHYNCTTRYDHESDGGVRWDDHLLASAWPDIEPMVSMKDRMLPTVAQYRDQYLKELEAKPDE